MGITIGIVIGRAITIVLAITMGSHFAQQWPPVMQVTHLVE
jgi:hypothetical protein